MRRGSFGSSGGARALFGALAVALVPAVSAPSFAGPAQAAPAAPAEAAARRSAHVVVISIDGLRPDAIERFGATTLRRLMREGAYSLSAQTILPSKTLPSHTSMVTGVGPAVHGITWNDDRTLLRGKVAVPTMFGVARGAGLTTAAFFSKSKFHHLEVDGTLDHVASPSGWSGSWPAETTLARVEEGLARVRPDLTFVHFGEPDRAGHAHGWMTARYAEAVRDADRAVARVLAEADEAFGPGSYTVIVTADHGGEGRGHGDGTPAHRTIPWIAWGAGVAGGTALDGPVRTMDTAATALWLLGVPAPGGWEGRPVVAAFAASP